MISRSRRAQFQHVFTFIMLIIIAGIVLLLGYKFIASLLQGTCEAEQLNFITTLKEDINTYAAYGTLKTVALSAPCNAVQMCFVDATVFTANPDGTYSKSSISFSTKNPVIMSEVNTPSTPPNNIFLLDDKDITTPLQFFGDKIALVQPGTPLCINATAGNFRVGFAGQGLTVRLTDKSS